MPGENIQDWSTTALNNGTADSGINFAEGQTRVSLNNSARGMMAAIAKDRNLKNGSITTGGTASALTFTSGVGYTSVPTGLCIRLKNGITNIGSTSLNMDGIGAVTIKDFFGADLVSGSMVVNTYSDLLYNGTNWILITPVQIGGFTTGDIKSTLKTTADLGWVMMNDGTIGDATSGGTTRANDDTGPLFTLIWNGTANADCAVSSGRGASAAADFAAHKTIALPKTLGRALAQAGSGSGLTTRALGAKFGEEYHQLTLPELAAHAHNTTVPWASDSGYVLGGGATVADVSGSSGYTSDIAGSNVAHNTMQPTSFVNFMIKL